MSPIKFTDIKDELKRELRKKLPSMPVSGEKEGFTLIEGFMAIPILSELSNDMATCGQNIPAVVLVGNSTGLLYTFSLKTILPNINA